GFDTFTAHADANPLALLFGREGEPPVTRYVHISQLRPLAVAAAIHFQGEKHCLFGVMAEVKPAFLEAAEQERIGRFTFVQVVLQPHATASEWNTKFV